jgi:hypothetical protein
MSAPVISYETPVGCFSDYFRASERVEALDLDPCTVIRVVTDETKCDICRKPGARLCPECFGQSLGKA